MATEKEQKKPAAKPKKSYSVLCTPDTLTRNNYFSDTYTSVMTVNGEKKMMDVTHISLPFRSQREKAVMKYFDISKPGMHDLYATLAQAISTQVNMCTRLNKKGVGSVMRVLAREVESKAGNKKDIYIVTEHLRPLADVYFNGKTTPATIFNFASRAAVLIRDVHEKMPGEQINIRVFDPEQIFVDDEGKFVFGTFQYAFQEGSNKEPLVPAETAPLHIEGRVQTGGPGTIGSDMHTLASILWSLLNGDGFDKPTPTGTPPKYATPEMVKALELGLDGDPEMFGQFRKQIQTIYKNIKHTEEGNIEIPVPLMPRCVDTELAQLDLVEVIKEVEVEAEKPVAEPVHEEEPLETVEFVRETVSALDTSKYVEAHESKREIEAGADDDFDFDITYRKPKFFLKQLAMAVFLIAIVIFILYVSIKTRLIPLW